MDDLIPKKKPGRPPKNDQDTRNLDLLFADFEQSFTVKVYRTDPEWCAGYLGCFHIGAGKGLTVEEIKNRFGGRKLELVAHDGNGGTSKKFSVMIDDLPRREGAILRRDGTTEQPTEPAQLGAGNAVNPLELIQKVNLPPNLQQQIYAHLLGMPGQQEHPANDLKNDMLQQQMMMDVMNQSRQSQMQMMQQQFDMQKRMMDTMRDMEDSRKPKDPMSDVNTTIKLMREINGIKSELGVGTNDSLASQVLETTVPLVETALTEYLGYKRMQAQAEVQKNLAVQDDKPPMAPRIASTPQPRQIPQGPQDTPVEQAHKMAEMYRDLPPQEQTAVMNAFIGALEGPNVLEYGGEIDQNQNIATQLESDTIDDAGEILTDEDRQLLNGRDNQNEGGHISDGQHTAPADNDDQADRPGDSPGFSTPTH